MSELVPVPSSTPCHVSALFSVMNKGTETDGTEVHIDILVKSAFVRLFNVLLQCPIDAVRCTHIETSTISTGIACQAGIDLRLPDQT